MFCPHCGTRLEEDGNFCPFCGGSLREEEEFFQAPEENSYENPDSFSYGAPENMSPSHTPEPESYHEADPNLYDQPDENAYGSPVPESYNEAGDNFYSRPQNTVGSPNPYDRGPQNQWVIGRSKTCDIIVHSNRVSRRHCLITRTPDGIFVIEDLGSTNGTFLNGMPLNGPTQLYPGDQLAFADTQFTFQIDQGFPVLV